MNDTSAKIEQRYQEMLMSRPPLERLQMASRMFDTGRKLVISGILKGGQQLAPSRVRAQFFLRMYGEDFSATERESIIKKIPNMQLDTDS